jgi:hypothetical protein
MVGDRSNKNEGERCAFLEPFKHEISDEDLLHMADLVRAFGPDGLLGEARRQEVDNFFKRLPERLDPTPESIYSIALHRLFRGDPTWLLEALERNIPLPPYHSGLLAVTARKEVRTAGRGKGVPRLVWEKSPKRESQLRQLRLGLEVLDALHDGEKKVDSAVGKIAERHGCSTRYVYEAKKFVVALRSRYGAGSGSARRAANSGSANSD